VRDLTGAIFRPLFAVMRSSWRQGGVPREECRAHAFGCQTVIGPRPKPSGMFWTVPGAAAIIALRCLPAQQPVRGLMGCAARLPELHFYIAHPTGSSDACTSDLVVVPHRLRLGPIPRYAY
jgi:hypothetical protein